MNSISTESLATFTSFAAETFGDKAAFDFPDRSLSFQEIDNLAARFAGGLVAQGLGPGDVVVLYLPNGWEWVVAYHAIARMGAAVVPANILLSVEEVVFILGHSQAKALICPAERSDSLQSADANFVTFPVGGNDQSFNDLLGAPPVTPCDRSPNDLFTIGYTSGTTGRPKGAMLTHGNIFASVAATATMHVRATHDVVISSLPFPHVYGNVVMNATFLTGAQLVSTPRFDPGEALRLIAEKRGTFFEGVPTMYYQMLAHPSIREADLSSLTRCTVGGQTMPSAAIEAVTERFGCPLLELWGMTEIAGPAITHSPYWPQRSGSIGLPLPGMEARIGNADGRGDAPAGTPGELFVRGPQIMAGYLHDPSATAATIDDEGWLATGDIGIRDSSGFFSIVDRKKDVIITGGYNIYPAEIEQIIATHPDVVMSAVVGIPDDEKGELACAAVVVKDGARVLPGDIIQHCRQHLATYKAPRQVMLVNDLPRTSTGKIMRRAIPTLFDKAG